MEELSGESLPDESHVQPPPLTRLFSSRGTTAGGLGSQHLARIRAERAAGHRSRTLDEPGWSSSADRPLGTPGITPTPRQRMVRVRNERASWSDSSRPHAKVDGAFTPGVTPSPRQRLQRIRCHRAAVGRAHADLSTSAYADGDVGLRFSIPGVIPSPRLRLSRLRFERTQSPSLQPRWSGAALAAAAHSNAWKPRVDTLQRNSDAAVQEVDSATPRPRDAQV